MQPLELGAHLHPQLGVEVGERLIEQEHLRLTHERAAHRHALALTTRELRRAAFQQLVEAEHPRHLAHPAVDLGAGDAALTQRVGEVARH